MQRVGPSCRYRRDREQPIPNIPWQHCHWAEPGLGRAGRGPGWVGPPTLDRRLAGPSHVPPPALNSRGNMLSSTGSSGVSSPRFFASASGDP